MDRPSADFDRLLAAYDYALPETAIAQRPVTPRDASRLLILDRGCPEPGAAGALPETTVRELPDRLAPGDLLVVNDTRVLRARLIGRKSGSGGRAEILLLRPLPGPAAGRGGEGGAGGARGEPGGETEIGGARWEAMLQVSGRLREGLLIELAEGFTARAIAPASGIHWEVEMAGPAPLAEFLARAGHVPLPPYIRRPDEEADGERYQTVYAARAGAVAAPTAGLHFTPDLLAALARAGIAIARVTLHVGAGTFEPLSPEQVARGELHPEAYELPEETAAAIEALRARGGRLIAVGTTTARVLESCAAPGRRVAAGAGETRLFIRPPYEPRVVDALLTNFHLPRSSLLMLVAAFAGRERLLAAYAEALRRGFRFYSYGDAMLVV